MTFDYKGKTAFITGGAQGIGQGVCMTFAGYGANVIVADFNLEGAQKTAQEIEKNGGSAYAVKIDVSDQASVEAALAEGVEKYKTIEILVNAAGIVVSSMIADFTEKDWSRVINVNLKGSFLVAQAVTKHMVQQKYGKVVFISSAGGKDAEYGNNAYCVSKAGVDMLTHCFALEMAEYNINVNSVNPTYVDTELMQGAFRDRAPFEGMTTEEYKAKLLKTVPLGRMGTKQEIGNLCAFLCDDEIGFLTGENVLIDGGKVMRL